MLGYPHFYNGNIKKIVAVFGALFNDISIGRPKQGGLEIVKVPLAYAPKQRYLARLKERDESVSIQLPRMAFEIADITRDASVSLNKLNQTLQRGEDGKTRKYWQAVPYVIRFQLSIISRTQDECLQVVEQILPFFNPTYNITVKGMEGPESIGDVPITIQSVTFEDSYQGGLSDSRRTIVYTLNFSANVKFAIGDITGGPDGVELIKSVDVSMVACPDGKEEGLRIRTKEEDDDELNEVVIDYNTNLMDDPWENEL